jgi:hypothetical protein
MKSATWNPVRRNRNIGTEKSGTSADNRLTIPAKWRNYRMYWDRLTDPVVWPVTIGGHEIAILVEPPRQDSLHAVTPQDIAAVLELLPGPHVREISTVVLRQPTRKQATLNPVWGRIVYYADLGQYSGPGVHLEAIPRGHVLSWGKSLTPFDRKELDALAADGHEVVRTRRGYEVVTTPQSVRHTQLFRTLPHEIGHAVDYLENCMIPALGADTMAEDEYITHAYEAKPALDKEEYANRYAREFFEKFSSRGLLPFPQIAEPEALTAAGLEPAWFGLDAGC